MPWPCMRHLPSCGKLREIEEGLLPRSLEKPSASVRFLSVCIGFNVRCDRDLSVILGFQEASSSSLRQGPNLGCTHRPLIAEAPT